MKELFELFTIFFKIGLFTFGGGFAMISQIKDVVVEKNKWITNEELLQIITIAESTPGPIAVNIATFIGYKRKKILGSVFTTLGVVLPSFIIIFIISMFLDNFMEYKIVQYAFLGINAAVAFLIIKMGITLFKTIEKKLVPISVFFITLILVIVFNILSITFSSIYFILISGIIGIIYYSIATNKKVVE